ncbi:NAD(P)-binding protein [Aaosphaeria arxii CBS 175.79]|uniref:NADP-dependent mannitol dehydrogenase n=1 Tax=Aaosphaeria arxii CBS 175.79 TaxID=1450172 RepID=A0A6A5Y3S5_9PLEO|nr:NAD(P)-binding protein [Aaosphaeria arxii CBS 175.79]KAF2019906.1 NAD(P)-binding protein [Aaosphaeria arxii CBS 175.79]
MPLYQPNLTTPVLEQFSLQGKTALVTGGSRGIGRQVVQALAEAGADVAFTYRTAEDAEQTAASIAQQTNKRIAAYHLDVTKRVDVLETFERIAKEFGNGRLDVVVANAGVCQNVPSLDYEEENWAYVNDVNYTGVMWTAAAAGKIFKRQGRGNLVITASVSANLVNVPQTQAGYNASKAAVVQLAKSLAVEWTDFARVNCVSPGYIMTEMLTRQPEDLQKLWLSQIPAKRICRPEELRGLYVFLASDAACYMTGSNIIIDGGYTLP